MIGPLTKTQAVEKASTLAVARKEPYIVALDPYTNSHVYGPLRSINFLFRDVRSDHYVALCLEDGEIKEIYH